MEEKKRNNYKNINNKDLLKRKVGKIYKSSFEGTKHKQHWAARILEKGKHRGTLHIHLRIFLKEFPSYGEDDKDPKRKHQPYSSEAKEFNNAKGDGI